jgi:hypothetical protein
MRHLVQVKLYNIFVSGLFYLEFFKVHCIVASISTSFFYLDNISVLALRLFFDVDSLVLSSHKIMSSAIIVLLLSFFQSEYILLLFLN